MEIDPIIKQAIEIGIKLGIEAYKNERNATLIPQHYYKIFFLST